MVALGIDIGGTTIKAGLVGPDGDLSRSSTCATPENGNPEPLMEALKRLVAPLLDGVQVVGVGVSVAGFMDREHEAMVLNSNMPDLAGFPLRRAVATAFGLDARLEVDSNAAAVAEHRFGAGRGAQRLLFLTLGTGVGGGVVIDGELLRFTGECAGDLGHVIVVPGGRRCSCGASGCLEATIARPALEEISDLPARELIERARAGETKATAVFEQAGALLGLGLASLAHIFQPDRIVIGGGVATVGAPLFGAADASFRANASSHFSRGVPVLPARFHGHEGVIGAAALFFRP